MHPKISAIIPIYNAERYLQQSVDSVLSQNYQDFELILVDDGSNDASGVMCDSMASQDSRVYVIHQQNEGAGAARNKGLSMAKGEYIVFIDADDFIEADYFEKLSTHTEDLVFIDVDRVTPEGRVVGKEYLSIYSGLNKDSIIRRQMTGRLPWGGVRKCVKLQLIRDNRIKYSNHKIGEEAIYSYLVLREAQSIGFIDTPVYHYLQHGESLSNSVVEDPWGPVAIALKEKVIEKGDYHQYGNTVNAFIETSAVVSLYKMALQIPWKYYRKEADGRWQCMLEQIDTSISTDRDSQSPGIRFLGIVARARLWSIVWAVSRIKG